MIDANPAWSRRKLSLEVCDWLDWRSPNGKLKEMSCRVALLQLHRDGALNLPAGHQRLLRPSRVVEAFAARRVEPAYTGSSSRAVGDTRIVVIDLVRRPDLRVIPE